ncbi:hypothetical protein CALVIDRAFT_551851 [Calocera viscosa TUFC12733]|uniref:GAR domain-containing protein n=1 Tax=Calocera viscosa (strain TUFC12733) TaxID=1330018 RepID=A0A167RZ21_CALVF|nr:hypothetical protein CALVIDRAFT_551851 [Calocera viscosa TUFC12733]
MLTLAKSFSTLRDASKRSPSSSPVTPTAGPSSPATPTQGSPGSPGRRHRSTSSTSTGTLTSLPAHRLRPSTSSNALAPSADERPRAKSMAPLQEGKSSPEIQLLAISAQITEVCYAISDIQTRIFEIQELRHASSSSGAGSGSGQQIEGLPDEPEPAGSIDRALMALDERLETVSAAVSAVDEALDPVLSDRDRGAEHTPTQASPFLPAHAQGDKELELVRRKHEDMRSQWEDVHSASEELKEELREDKWLAVFRTVSAQADDMMGSLEKAVSMCHDFIWQAGRMDDLHSSGSSSLLSPTRNSVNLDNFSGILASYESKKKYYVPATTKVISVIDKGMRDRATKNGECLRRHAELRLRWRNLRERMGRIDAEMEGVRLMLTQREDPGLGPSASASASQAGDSDDEGSLVSRVTAKSKMSTSMLSTASAASASSKPRQSTLSRSMSPLRRFASKLSAGVGIGLGSPPLKSPADGSPPALRKRSSYFSMRSSMAGTPEPQRTRPRLTAPLGRSTPLNATEHAPRWNSSTKVEYVEPKPQPDPATPRGTPGKARPIISNPIPILPPGTTTPTANRRLSSMSSSRPPSRSSIVSQTPIRPTSNRVVSGPATSSAPRVPTVPTTPGPPTTPTRRRASTPNSHSKHRSVSSSRASSPPPVPPLPASFMNRSVTPGLQQTPRPRPSSPSHIPIPANSNSRANTPVSVLHFFGGMDDPDDPPTSLMQRALSPTFSTISSSGGDLRRSTISSSGGETRQLKSKRRESNSKLPIPTFQVSAEPPSPPDSNGRPSLSPGSAASSIIRPQTPESTLKARASQMPFYQTPKQTPKRQSMTGSVTRPLLKAPPSSFRESASQSQSGRGTPSSTAGTPSRPSSRNGGSYDRSLFSPSLDENPVPQYVPAGAKDPLDSEVAKTVNGLAHGFLIERVDPIGIAPSSSGEHKARYAVSNSLGKKVIVCRLVIMTRSSGTGGARKEMRKVMVRVGGGWQDLDIYLLNRQAGVM